MAKRKAPIDKSRWTMEQLLAHYKNPYEEKLSMHKMIANSIKTSCKLYNGREYKTNLESLYFLRHGHKKADVDKELAKWIDLDGLDLNTPVVLPERFFQ